MVFQLETTLQTEDGIEAASSNGFKVGNNVAQRGWY